MRQISVQDVKNHVTAVANANLVTGLYTNRHANLKNQRKGMFAIGAGELKQQISVLNVKKYITVIPNVRKMTLYTKINMGVISKNRTFSRSM